jgi:hypothetical protein
MKKITLLLLLSISTVVIFSQQPSLRLKAFKRYTINSEKSAKGDDKVAGAKTPSTSNASEPEYYIYLIAFKVPYIKLERVWLHQNLYQVRVDKVAGKPIILKNTGYPNDTLVRYTDETVWKVTITGKVEGDNKPKKDIESLVAQNELTFRLNDKKGTMYTRSVKQITLLKPVKKQ